MSLVSGFKICNYKKEIYNCMRWTVVHWSDNICPTPKVPYPTNRFRRKTNFRSIRQTQCFPSVVATVLCIDSGDVETQCATLEGHYFFFFSYMRITYAAVVLQNRMSPRQKNVKQYPQSVFQLQDLCFQ